VSSALFSAIARVLSVSFEMTGSHFKDGTNWGSGERCSLGVRSGAADLWIISTLPPRDHPQSVTNSQQCGRYRDDYRKGRGARPVQLIDFA